MRNSLPVELDTDGTVVVVARVNHVDDSRPIPDKVWVTRFQQFPNTPSKIKVIGELSTEQLSTIAGVGVYDFNFVDYEAPFGKNLNYRVHVASLLGAEEASFFSSPVYIDVDVHGKGVRIHTVDNPETGVWCNVSYHTRARRSKSAVHNFLNGTRRAVRWKSVNITATLAFYLQLLWSANILEQMINEVIVYRSVRGEVMTGLVTSVNFNHYAAQPSGLVPGTMELELIQAEI